MQITFNMVIVIILVALIWIALFILLLRVLFWAIRILYLFLSKYAWFTNYKTSTTRFISKWYRIFKKWWRKRLPNLVNTFEESYEVFGDIVVIALGLGFVVERVHDIQNTADSLYTFIQLLVLDIMIENFVLWSIFGILLALWFLGRRRKYITDKDYKRMQKKTLSTISITLKALNTTIQNMSHNITQQSGKLDKLDKSLNNLSKSIKTKVDDK